MRFKVKVSHYFKFGPFAGAFPLESALASAVFQTIVLSIRYHRARLAVKMRVAGKCLDIPEQ